MIKKYEYNGHTYWIKVEPAVHATTGQTGFIAYVSDDEPNGVVYGLTAKDPQGKALFFETEYAAFANANAIKQSELKTKR